MRGHTGVLKPITYPFCKGLLPHAHILGFAESSFRIFNENFEKSNLEFLDIKAGVGGGSFFIAI